MKLYRDMDSLCECVINCRNCKLSKTRNKPVFGEGKIDADLMFIAEAPGYEEDLCGKPFVGKAGKLLDEVFSELNINREEIYISNIVKCRPPSNRNPESDEISSCLDYLRNQVMLIKPKVIVLLGSVALKTILGEEHRITRERGQFIEKRGILYLPTFHPSAVLRDPTKRADFTADLRLAKEKSDSFKL